MSNRIITIEREYASGGREVGELVAKQLGIPFYNREILEMASERCGVSVDYLASAEEAAPKSFLYTLMLSSNPTRSLKPTSSRNWQKRATVSSLVVVPATSCGIWNI